MTEESLRQRHLKAMYSILNPDRIDRMITEAVEGMSDAEYQHYVDEDKRKEKEKERRTDVDPRA